MPAPGPADAPVSTARFSATRWSLVAAAGVQDAGAARRALIELCVRYWYPVYAYVRGSGHAPAVAQDISRGFFDDLLHQGLSLDQAQSRGRFRHFLLESLNRFLRSDWQQAREQQPVLEFEGLPEAHSLEARYRTDVAAGLTPEQAYQRSYALEVLATALARLEREAAQAGRLAMFEAMQPFLSAEPAPGQFEELGALLDMSPLATVVALKRLRQRFRELAEAELAETVASAEDLQVERIALARALAPS